MTPFSAIRALSIIASLSFLLSPTAAAQAFDLYECGQVVPRGQTGVLQVDLDCPSSEAQHPIIGVRLEPDATLDLNGHTLSGGAAGVTMKINTMANYTIVGPGEISGSTSTGIALNRGNLLVRNVTISGHGRAGVDKGGPGRVVLENVIIENTGAASYSRGAASPKLVARNVTLRNNEGAAIYAGRLRASGLVVESNAEGIKIAKSARISGLEANNNQGPAVISKGSLRLEDCHIEGNAGPGVVARKRVRVSSSLLTGNDGGSDGADLLTFNKPRGGNLDCSLSQRCGEGVEGDVVGPEGCVRFGANWGVCSGDF